MKGWSRIVLLALAAGVGGSSVLSGDSARSRTWHGTTACGEAGDGCDVGPVLGQFWTPPQCKTRPKPWRVQWLQGKGSSDRQMDKGRGLRFSFIEVIDGLQVFGNCWPRRFLAHLAVHSGAVQRGNADDRRRRDPGEGLALGGVRASAVGALKGPPEALLNSGGGGGD